MKLTDFSVNHFSHSGEDGIIAKIFDIIGVKYQRCIEFGAADGLFVSNTAYLWQNGWHAILIEPDDKSFGELEANTRSYQNNVTLIQSFVTPTGENSLENILKREQIPADVDLISIDIDGNDYYILKTLTLQPSVIVCEFNPMMPIDFDFVAHEGADRQGASAKALIALAKSKGYSLVAITLTNLLFVRDEFFHLFEDYNTTPADLMPTHNLIYLVTTFSGEYMLSKKPPFGMTQPFREDTVSNSFYILPDTHKKLPLHSRLKKAFKLILKG